MPTIYHRSRFEMVGTLRFAHPTKLLPILRFCELICLAHKRNRDAQPRQINTTGKSLLIFRNRVKPGNQKSSA